MAKKDFILNVKGFKAAWGEEASAQKDITVELRDSEGKTVATGTTDENGNVTLNAPAEGTYTAAIVKTPYEYYIPVDAKVVAKATKTVGEKLTPTVKLTATKLALKTKQSVTVRATGLAKGDYVKSWTSSKKSVATVDKNGKITATSKEGTAVITVTLASKKTAKVTVTVKMIRTTSSQKYRRH